MTKQAIEEALSRAHEAALEWADKQREFSHIWNGVIVSVTVDGVDYKEDYTRRKSGAAEISKTFTYKDEATGLAIACECLGGS
jgi:hypothetical protein